MTCFECGSDSLALAEVLLTGTRNGKEFQVWTEGYACNTCKASTIDSQQSAQFTQKVSDAYRRTAGLLTGEEIRQLRASLGMSQSAFAEHLHVGIASVKRWEAGQIQERAMDELIRIKCDTAYASKSFDELRAQRTGARSAVADVYQLKQMPFKVQRPSMNLDLSRIDLSEYSCKVVAAPVAA